MKKTVWFATVTVVLIALLAMLFVASYYSSSSYWQNFALNLLTDLIGALVTALLLERLLRQAYIEYREEQVDIGRKLFQEVTARATYWFLFEANGLEDTIKQMKLNEKDITGPYDFTKDFVRAMTQIMSDSVSTVIFRRKDDRVKSILLNVLRSSLREPLSGITIPSSFSLFGSKGQKTLELQSMVVIEAFEKAVPKILESKEVQAMGHPLLIEAMRKFPERSESIRQQFMSEQAKTNAAT